MQSPSRAAQALALPSLLRVSLQPVLRHWGPRARFWSHLKEKLGEGLAMGSGFLGNVLSPSPFGLWNCTP